MAASSTSTHPVSANTEPSATHPVIGSKPTWHRLQRPVISYVILALVLLMTFLALYFFSDDSINNRPSPQLKTESSEPLNSEP